MTYFVQERQNRNGSDHWANVTTASCGKVEYTTQDGANYIAYLLIRYHERFMTDFRVIDSDGNTYPIHSC